MTLARSYAQGGGNKMWSHVVWWKCIDAAEKLAASTNMVDEWVACRRDSADVQLV
jgi:hypothetical protein